MSGGTHHIVIFEAEDVGADMMMMQIASEPVVANATLVPTALEAEIFDWFDQYDQPEVSDEQSSGPVQPNAPPVPPFHIEWEWFDDTADELLSVIQADEDALVPDVSPLPVQDGWHELDDATDDSWLTETNNAPVESAAAATPQSPEDAWDWLDHADDDVWPITEGDCEPVSGVPAATEITVEGAWPWDDYVEPVAIEAGYQTANGPNLLLAPQDPPFFEGDQDYDEFFADDFGNIDVDPCPPDEAWDWYSDLAVEGLEWLDSAPVGANAGVAADQPAEPAWDWSPEDVGDDWQLVADGDSEPVGADAAVIAAAYQDDWQDDPAEDAWPETLSEALVPDAVLVAGLPELDWVWSDEIEDDTDAIVRSADVLSADVPLPDGLPEPAWDWLDEVEDVTPDIARAGDVLGPDVPPDPAQSDVWEDADLSDSPDWFDSAPVGPDAPSTEPIVEPDHDWTESVEDAWWEWPLEPIGENFVPDVPAPAWEWNDEAEDYTAEIIESAAFVAPPVNLQIEPAWDWNDPDADDTALIAATCGDATSADIVAPPSDSRQIFVLRADPEVFGLQSDGATFDVNPDPDDFTLQGGE